MCGIAGSVWFDSAKALDRGTLRRMTDVLAHRGPDGEGSYFSAGVALGHRRLAVIDVAGGRQPLANEDDSIWVVLNGEIYNYRPLRQRLEQRGHRFRTQSDTETLVHLYEDEGPAMLGQLEGMFALALWDGRRRELLLARDRLGKKPLVYRLEDGRLLFASELKSLLEVPGVPRELDPQALDQYLTYQYVPHPRTIYRGINKLPPGHLAFYREGRLEVRPWWQLDFQAEEARPCATGSASASPRDRPAADYAAELRDLLTAAVECRLQSEVPLGAFLSGGIDSTIVVGLMRKLGGPLRTFSIGFPVAQYDETRYARLAARHFGTQHEEFQVEPRAVDVLPRLVWHYDEPFADSSALPTWCLSELTKRTVTVALSGDGGDELFAGYDRYRAVWLAERLDRLPAVVRRCLAARLWQRLPAGGGTKSLTRRWQRFAAALADAPARRYLDWVSVFNKLQRQSLYRPEFSATLGDNGPGEFLTAAMARADGRDAVTAASLADVVTYLPCDLLTKVDTASMAHGLECRQPFLDHRVVELAARMPARLKLRGGRGKRILRQAFGDLLPAAIRRRRKMGFGVPLDSWFRGELRDFARQILLDPLALGRGYFRSEAVHSLWDEHQAGRANHSHRLWALLILELWQRQWS
jgi:asparagine synthase (glutamine-hydrolysing)